MVFALGNSNYSNFLCIHFGVRDEEALFEILSVVLFAQLWLGPGRRKIENLA